ncbi:LytTR family transcriptional regulator DNA-binding domain-containing protein [Fulvivirga sp. 29W222]|uniref:LytTR family transcriptional regulator DNA-binding domain-containing protein n=1 Tax=Fulvivirga marina TaxID=2494733 RepID=A0A937KFM2_9BACT|nr:LytTR family transcriptional regulator DNA-binding domain-containing protein [Fulvivirga marina]MBL6448430.1 LytTR family transcriptional regulator DNA-binding domain-containing protein [Fulvivirga marina]
MSNVTKQKVNVLVVEDEILLALDIKMLLTRLNYNVQEIVSSADKALNILDERAKEIDIMLIDIVLEGDKDGIEFARVIKKRYNIPFIFVSSYFDGNLIERAKSVNPYGYLLKPVNEKELLISIELALSNFSNQPPDKAISNKPWQGANTDTALQINDSLFLKKDQHFQRVTLDDILLLEADNNYTLIYSKSERFLYSTVLRKMEEKLPSGQFLRVHRSYVVNIQSVTGFEGNTLFIGEMRIPVSKQYREEVFRLFKAV